MKYRLGNRPTECLGTLHHHSTGWRHHNFLLFEAGDLSISAVYWRISFFSSAESSEWKRRLRTDGWPAERIDKSLSTSKVGCYISQQRWPLCYSVSVAWMLHVCSYLSSLRHICRRYADWRCCVVYLYASRD